MIHIRASMFTDIRNLDVFVYDSDDLSLIKGKTALNLLLDYKSSDVLFYTNNRPKYFDLLNTFFIVITIFGT